MRKSGKSRENVMEAKGEKRKTLGKHKVTEKVKTKFSNN